ncbi:RNA-directed DNA polymerase, eukaryota, reverse transcriptase zinc-binding domain protein [Tanacetum coccineum]
MHIEGPYKLTIVVIEAVAAIVNSPEVPEHDEAKTQYQNEVNDIRAERIAKSANPLALLAAAQPYSDNYYQAPKPHRTNTTSSSTRLSASIRHKGKGIAKPVTPQSESVSKEDSDLEEARRDKDMQKNLALLAKYFKKLYKPTNNNLPKTSQTARTRLKIPHQGSQVLHQNGIQCFNYKGFGHYAKECKNPKRWLSSTDEEIDEHELEAHYSFMAKIQEVLPEESSSTDQPLEQVQNHDENNVFANERRHFEQPRNH